MGHRCPEPAPVIFADHVHVVQHPDGSTELQLVERRQRLAGGRFVERDEVVATVLVTSLMHVLSPPVGAGSPRRSAECGAASPPPAAAGDTSAG